MSITILTSFIDAAWSKGRKCFSLILFWERLCRWEGHKQSRGFPPQLPLLSQVSLECYCPNGNQQAFLPVLQNERSMALGPKTKGQDLSHLHSGFSLRTLKGILCPFSSPAPSLGEGICGTWAYTHTPFIMTWELKSCNCLLNGPR